MNQLEDSVMMDRLIKASRAGVPIDLSVRGFCCLRPGLPGTTEHIRIRSIVGRFLEHSRIFHFTAGADDPLQGKWFFGSADWMHRNLDHRVEVISPIYDLDARRKLCRILDVNFEDCHDAWQMNSDGTYQRLSAHGASDPEGPSGRGTFETLCRDARDADARAHRQGEADRAPIRDRSHGS